MCQMMAILIYVSNDDNTVTCMSSYVYIGTLASNDVLLVHVSNNDYIVRRVSSDGYIVTYVSNDGYIGIRVKLWLYCFMCV